ncbi:hypothetical protein FDECE_4074 [Fusarium decemcellulare]|nr:hypothetical protein FDECE_4074 [Fusarium decemcellulare]
MPQVLAMELAGFLPKAWKETSSSENMDSPTRHSFYKKLSGLDGHEKTLYYPYWFFLAVCWGPGHPDLSTVRKDMSTLWKVEFPTDKIFYPGKESIELQQSRFAGTRPDIKILLGVAYRARYLERTIESTSVDDIAQALQDELPALLTPNAEADRIKLLELELKVRTHQLLQTRRSMDTMNDKLGSVEGMADEAYQIADMDCVCRQECEEGIRECQEEIQKLKTQLEASEKAHAETKDAYKKELAEVNDKADKAIKTCAFLMSALLPPGSNKRKRETEGDEA